MGLPLGKIEAFAGERIEGGRPALRTASVCTDSRKLKAGEIFIALRGEKFDAHGFINRKLAKTASLVIVNQSWYRRVRPTAGHFLPVRDTGEAMLQIARAHLSDLNVRVVAITGSNGKTTTRALAAAVLRRKYRVLESPHSFNNRIGIPLTVFALDPSHEVAVLELGTNHFGEIEELSRTVRPAVAVITNIGHSHLEFLKNRRGVLRAKTEIVKGMGAGGAFCVNGDDHLLRAYQPPAGIRKSTFGFSAGNQLRGRRFESGFFRGTRFTLPGGASVTLKIPGRGAAINALAALSAGRALGVPLASGARALAQVPAPKQRMEILSLNGYKIVVDCYNANPDSLQNVAGLFEGEKIRGRKIAVLGDMAELGSQSLRLHREAGRLVNNSGFQVLLTCGRWGREIAAGARAAGMRNCFAFDKPEGAAEAIRQSAQAGDLVLLKGSRRMGMERIADILAGKN